MIYLWINRNLIFIITWVREAFFITATVGRNAYFFSDFCHNWYYIQWLFSNQWMRNGLFQAFYYFHLIFINFIQVYTLSLFSWAELKLDRLIIFKYLKRFSYKPQTMSNSCQISNYLYSNALHIYRRVIWGLGWRFLVVLVVLLIVPIFHVFNNWLLTCSKRKLWLWGILSKRWRRLSSEGIPLRLSDLIKTWFPRNWLMSVNFRELDLKGQSETLKYQYLGNEHLNGVPFEEF